MNLRRAIFCAVVMFAAIPGLAAAQTASPKTVDAVVDRIVAQEKAEMQMLHQYSPLVETYIQLLKPDETLGTVPGGDKYFLGKADLGKGLDLMPLSSDKGAQNTKYAVGGLGSFLAMSMEFLPQGLLADDLRGYRLRQAALQVRICEAGVFGRSTLPGIRHHAGQAERPRALRGPPLGGRSGISYRALQWRLRTPQQGQLLLPFR